MLRTKETLPPVYSESYDFQLFTSLLDAVQARRAINIERVKVAHNPRECFIEDLPHLASNFDLPINSSRELLSNYLTITRCKGTDVAIEALLALSGVKDFTITVIEGNAGVRQHIELSGDFSHTNWELFDILRYRWLHINCTLGIVSKVLSVIESHTFKVPEGITEIGGYSFYCSELTDIELPNSLVTVKDSAFQSCSLLSLNLPKNVANIGFFCFKAIPTLQTITVDPENSTFKSEGNCLIEKATKTIILGCTNSIIPKGVEIIAGYSFMQSKITTVRIPEGVVEVGEGVFSDCYSLRSITLPQSLQIIRQYAFSSIELHDPIIIPSTVGVIDSAGLNVTGDTYCEIAKMPPTWDSDWTNSGGGSSNNNVTWGYNNIKTDKLYDYVVHDDKVYLTRYKGSNLDVIIPATIDKKAVVSFSVIFSGNKLIKSIRIPASVTTIAIGAFLDCTALVEIIVDPNSQYFKTVDGVLYSKDEKVLIACPSKKPGSSVTIPKTVVEILPYSFGFCKDLQNILFESDSNLKTIGKNAFYYCDFTSIVIPKGVIKLDKIFNNCASLESITFEAGSKLTTIGNYAFEDCRGLTSITIPISVTSIEDAAFSACISLESITIPISITSMGYYVFERCPRLIIYVEAESKPEGWSYSWYSSDNIAVVWDSSKNIIASDGYIYTKLDDIKYKLKDGTAIVAKGQSNKLTVATIPKSVVFKGVSYTVTGADQGAFRGCNKIESMTLPFSKLSPNNYGSNYWDLFDYYTSGVPTSLKTVVITSGTDTFNFNFDGCNGITSITIPDTTITIANYVLRCASLASFIIPASVTTIGDRSFEGCSSLTSITIPIGVTKIGSWAFSTCPSLTIYAKATSRPGGWYDWNPSNCPVVWDSTNNIIADDGNIYAVLDGIRYALRNGNATVVEQPSTITTAKIPVSVTFNNVTYSVTSIDNKAFYGCNKLTNIMVESSNANYKSIDGNLYNKDGSTLLQYAIGKIATEFTIPASVTTIGNSALFNCKSLTSVIIPTSVTNIDDIAFSACNGLASVTFEKGSKLTTIGINAFRECYCLTSVTIPATVTSIGDRAFMGCSFTSIIIPISVTNIGVSIFDNCDSYLTIYAEAASQPAGWARGWNSYRTVVWGYNGYSIL